MMVIDMYGTVMEWQLAEKEAKKLEDGDSLVHA
jgi:hypothetical protein